MVDLGSTCKINCGGRWWRASPLRKAAFSR